MQQPLLLLHVWCKQQHDAGECDTGPAAHQAAWQAADTPMSALTVAEDSQTAFCMPVLGKQQIRLAALFKIVDLNINMCNLHAVAANGLTFG